MEDRRKPGSRTFIVVQGNVMWGVDLLRLVKGEDGEYHHPPEGEDIIATYSWETRDQAHRDVDQLNRDNGDEVKYVTLYNDRDPEWIDRDDPDLLAWNAKADQQDEDGYDEVGDGTFVIEHEYIKLLVDKGWGVDLTSLVAR